MSSAIMDAPDSEYIKLKDGRILGYAEYGDNEGFPIIALHGTPGSRIWFKENDPASKELGIRLITIDRPGYGNSSKKTGRKIIDFTSDINELIDATGITEFSIFGVSGGGAYTLAYAASQHPKHFKTGLVASVFEFKNGHPPKEMCTPNRIGFFFAKWIPWLLRYSYRQQKKLIDSKPEEYLKASRKNVTHLCPSDREVIQNDESLETMLLHFKEAFKSSVDEVVHELRLLSKKWEIDFDKIISPVEVWHGRSDTLSPISGMEEFVKQIPKVNVHFLENKGHFLDEEEEIWKSILISLLP